MSLMSRLKKLEQSIGIAPGPIANPRTRMRKDRRAFITTACYDMENQLHSVILRDGTSLKGAEAAQAMKDLAGSNHPRVIAGIDPDVVIGNKPGIPYEQPV
jgi:hypothetical protein